MADITITVDEARILLKALNAFASEAELEFLEQEATIIDRISREVDNADFERDQVLPEPPPTKFEEDEYAPNVTP